jgi:adenine-specific DNA-methyltransferase
MSGDKLEKLKLHSPDLTQDNIAKIRDLFPGCVTEARDAAGQLKLAVDFDQLRQELSDHIVEGPQERYHLNWPGKREALLTANAAIAKTLRPASAESVNFDTTQNLFIEGDNLEALKLLQESYLGKVKMIYIDPPYNTGNDFIYDDDFSENSEQFLTRSNQSDIEQNRLVANPETNGRFHSDWVSMILARLKLAKRFLKKDGAIFVSCDEGEHPRLRLVMDEVFGQSNFIADFVWAAGRKNDSKHVSISHEYIVCYANDKEFLKSKKLIWRQRKKGLEDIYKEYGRLRSAYKGDHDRITAEMKAWYSALADDNPAKSHKHFSHSDEKGIYFPDNISWPGGGGPKYEVLHPNTKRAVKIPSRGWITSDPRKLDEWIADNRVHFGPDETTVPCIKSHLKDKEYETPYSVFYQDGRAASKRLRDLMGADLFDYPKDEIILQELIEMLTSADDVILDFFAGSSTTAHSVFLQNAKDGANRKFIMVQLREGIPEESDARKLGFGTIPELSEERIRRAGKKILEGECHPNWNKDVGFRVLKIDASNMNDVYYTPQATTQQNLLDRVDTIKPDRSGEDLLFHVLVDWGVELSLPITREIILGKQVFFVDGNALAACFETGITEELVKELAKRLPVRAVFRDTGFASDAMKINVKQIFKQLSPGTDVKAI